MATSKNTSNKNNSKKNSSHQPLSEWWAEWNPASLIQNEKAPFISGLILLGLMIYLFVVLISFFFTGRADQSIVEGLRFGQLRDAAPCANWAGVFGAWLANIIMNRWFGISSLLLAFFGLAAALRLMRVRTFPLVKGFVYCAFLFIWFSVFFGFFFVRPNHYVFLGGAHGYHIAQWLKAQTGIPGTILVLLISMILFLVFAVRNTMSVVRDTLQLSFLKKGIVEGVGKLAGEDFSSVTVAQSQNLTRNTQAPKSSPASDDESESEETPEEFFARNKAKENAKPIWDNTDDIFPKSDSNLSDDGFEPVHPDRPDSPHCNPDEVAMTVEVAQEEEKGPEEETEDILLTDDSKDASYDLLAELGEYDPTADLSHFKFPPVRLLNEYEDNNPVINQEEQLDNKRRIVEVLESFQIHISSIKATVGPTVTLYEIVPDAGVRISKIKSLENDIALNLAALGIRIIAPMPGKGTIGIEVPNRESQTVSMRGLIQSKKFQETKYDLPVILGKTIMNEAFMFDLCKMPHLLVAGATGQGKSVGLNAIITSLLYKKHPAELKLVMVDPKMVEFSIYSGIDKHYLAKVPGDDPAIITEPDKVVQTLKSLTVEMDSRYELLSKAHCRNVKEYNAKFKLRKLNPEKGHRFMPYIVIIIDEFGDLIMTAGKEIELPIARIAQKARAVGMHMIIATQRPTTNIITGTIKANFPARLAFKVTSGVDSKTILDTGGAQQLIGKGDALFSQGSDLTRLQCAFVDTPEVEDIVNFIADQQGYPYVFELPDVAEEGGTSSSSDAGTGPRDPLFDDAARLVVVHQQGSTSMVQRKFSIGFNRAGRIMDQLEAANIVGPTEGSKARQVMIEDLIQLEQKLASLRQNSGQ